MPRSKRTRNERDEDMVDDSGGAITASSSDHVFTKKKHQSLAWKSVEINPKILQLRSDDFAGFMSLEVLDGSDYSSMIQSIRPSSSIDGSEAEEKVDDSLASSTRKKIKKKSQKESEREASSEEKKVLDVKKSKKARQSPNSSENAEPTSISLKNAVDGKSTHKSAPNPEFFLEELQSDEESVMEFEEIGSDLECDLRSSENRISERDHEVIEKQEETREKSDVAEDYCSWEPYGLHPLLMQGIRKLGFIAPTPIQAACLLPAIRDWRDIVGVAQTGSGKTLAFALPILQAVISTRSQQRANRGDQSDNAGVEQSQNALVGLIVTPTRELCMQIVSHIDAVGEFAKIRAVGLVGGLSVQKQERLLSKNPPIIVATPGRVWDLIISDNSAFRNLSNLRFFVLDEADRMVASGHFKELDKIISYIQSFRDSRIQKLANSESSESDDQIGTNHESDEEEVDEESEYQSGHSEDGLENEAEIERKRQQQKKGAKKKARMQVLLFSATLTIKDEGRGPTRSGKPRDSKTARPDAESKGSAVPGTAAEPVGKMMLEELAHRLPFSGKPYIADYSSKHIIAPSVNQCLLECLDEERDAFAYWLLVNHQDRALLFCNSILVVKKVTDILRCLKLLAFPLHAEMQQKQRLSVLDKFKAAKRAVLVCTDVAARGVDIPNVPLVVHFHVPMSPELYVHRSGRTGRASSTGRSVLIVGERDQNEFQRLLKVLSFPVDSFVQLHPSTRAVSDLSKCVALAQKIVAVEDKRNRERSSWKKAVAIAEATGLDLEDMDLNDEWGGMNAVAKKRAGSSQESSKRTGQGQRKLNQDDDAAASRMMALKRKESELVGLHEQLSELLRKPIQAERE